MSVSPQALSSKEPFSENFDCWGVGPWPASWIATPHPEGGPSVTAFRLRFSVDQAHARQVHVTADERYKLFLNSRLVGRGSERGTPDHWYYETYQLDLQPGENTLVAVVWWLGELSPIAQTSAASSPRFLLASESDDQPDISTGIAPWEYSHVPGYAFIGTGPAWGTGTKIHFDAREYPWGIETGEGGKWHLAVAVHEARSVIGPWGLCSTNLRPAALPPMQEIVQNVGLARHARHEQRDVSPDGFVSPSCHDADLSASWNDLLQSACPLRIPARSRQVVIVDLEDYFCAYPELTISGGRDAEIRIHWAESFFLDSAGETKGHRDEINERWFRGVGDTFIADGAEHRSFTTLWWEAGRYLEVEVTTHDEDLIIHGLAIRETRYPLELDSVVHLSDDKLNALVPLMMRSLQMCSHETFMDCPYYEQIMYAGDTRLEALVTYATSRDSRLPVKAVELLGRSVDSSGLSASRYPARPRQVIPGFSLYWIAMVHDLALWKGERSVVAQCLPRVRTILETFLAHRTADGLVRIPDGWHFVDWVPTWTNGCPSIGRERICGITAWLLIIVLRQAAELECWAGLPLFADRYLSAANEIAQATDAAFYDDSRGLMADDLARTHWSEHANSLCLLSGTLSPQRSLALTRSMRAAGDSLAPATIYFSHYYLDAMARFGSMDSFFQRLDLWSELTPRGFKTTYETPGNSRSDCHAWGAHPLYHFFATILGIRPDSFGFDSVVIQPRLGHLTEATGSLVHPQGTIEVSLSRQDERLLASISLPPGISGRFEFSGLVQTLNPGHQEIVF